MKNLIAILLLFTLCLMPVRGDDHLPATVIAGTEPVPSEKFSLWIEEDATKYNGTFSGDIGGDTTGTVTIKVKKGKEGEASFIGSGTFTQTPAGFAPTVVKFENAYCYEDGVFTLGAFNLVFVTYGKIRGVVVGGVFVKKD